MRASQPITRFVETCRGAAIAPSLGLACILVWNQCILYGQRISVDGGIVTVVTTALRCAATLVLLAVALSPVWRGKIPHWWEIVSIALMTLSGFAAIASNAVESQVVSWVGTVASAVGITWGGGMWIQSCIRYDLRDVFVFATAAMGISAVVGIVVCYLSWPISASLGIILPITSYACYRRSLDDLPPAPQQDQREPEPLRLMPRLTGELRNVLLSIALFSIVLGISRGYPGGASLVIPDALLPVQFILVTAVVVYVLARLSSPSFVPKAGPIWACYIALLMLGVILVFSLDARLVGWGATLISAINLLQVLMLWILACDAGRDPGVHPYVPLAILWLAHLFFRELGRATILVAPAGTYAAQVAYLAVAVCLLAAAVALLFAGKSSMGKTFFAEYVYPVAAEREAASQDAGEITLRAASDGSAQGATEDVAAVGTATATPAITPAAPAMAPAVPQSPGLDWLAREFGLTQRECEVAEQLAFNRSAAVIAERLFLSKETVRSYTKSVYAKTGVHSKAELASLFEAHGDARMSM